MGSLLFALEGTLNPFPQLRPVNRPTPSCLTAFTFIYSIPTKTKVLLNLEREQFYTDFSRVMCCQIGMTHSQAYGICIRECLFDIS
jgi:hypothetical protein